MTEPVHPIEVESYRRLAARCDLSKLAPGSRAVVERVLHASADFSFVDSMVVSEESVAAGVAAIERNEAIVVDVEMVRAGISRAAAECYLAEARSLARPAPPETLPAAATSLVPTLSARAMRVAAERHPNGGVFVVGCAPTALEELIALTESGALRPSIVVGVPVGLVGAAEAKEHLRAVAVPSISNVGERGGSAVAAAVVNALVRRARP